MISRSRKYSSIKRFHISPMEYFISSFMITLIYIISFPRYIQSISIAQFNIFIDIMNVYNLLFAMPFISLLLAVMTYKRRSVLGVVTNVTIPILVFFSLVVAQYSLIVFIATYIVIIIILLSIIFINIFSKVKLYNKKNTLICLSKNIIFAVLFAVIMPTYCYYNRGMSLAETIEYYEELEEKIDKFDAEYGKDGKHDLPVELNDIKNWKKLNFKERYELLHNLFAYECEINNMPLIPFKAKKLNSRDTVFGAFDDETLVVYIDQIHLAKDNAESCINTVLHESRHYYQYCVCSVINNMDDKGIDYSTSTYFNQAADWAKANKDYENNDGYYGYYTNSLEADARDYAETEIEYYEDFFVSN